MRIPMFLIKLFIILAMLWVFVFIIVMPQYTTIYNASIVDKYHRLRSLDEPKIILVGGSNVAYGFYSARIQEAFNMPVVNFGINGAFGQAFHADMIRRHIGEGDIIILAPEEFNNETTNIPDTVMVWTAIENNFYLWRGIDRSNYWNMLLGFPTYLSRATGLFITNSGNQPVVDHSFARAALNEYGDHAFPRPHSIIVEGQYHDFFTDAEMSPAMREFWNEYYEFVRSRGATLFMSSPAILSRPDMQNLATLQSQLENELNFPVISQLEDYVFPSEYFYDTGFHLNEIGMDARTKQLIADLKNALDGR